MLLAQEIQHAGSHSELLTFALVVLSLGWQGVKEVLLFLGRRSESGQSPGELAGRLARAEARLASLERGSQEVRDIVIATKTVVDRIGNQ